MSIPAPRPANPTPKEVMERRDELANLIHDHLDEGSDITRETISSMGRQDPYWANGLAEMLITGGWISFPVKVDPNAPHYRTPPPGDSGVSRPRRGYDFGPILVTSGTSA